MLRRSAARAARVPEQALTPVVGDELVVPTRQLDISRTELALRQARFTALSPATNPFAVQEFRRAADQLVAAARTAQLSAVAPTPLKRNNVVLSALARKPIQLGSAQLHVLAVQRDLVGHARLAAQMLRELKPAALVIPCGERQLYKSLLCDQATLKHMRTDYKTEREFVAAETAWLRRCHGSRWLNRVIDDRVLVRVPATGSEVRGLAARLRQRATYDHHAQRMALVPFLAAAWEAQLMRVRIAWAGLPHDVHLQRTRNRTFESEWAAARAECDRALTHASADQWLGAWVEHHSQRVSPRSYMSDVNMRHSVDVIRRRFGRRKQPMKVLMITDATELHLVHGWAAAEKELGPVAISEITDDESELIDGFRKSQKDPMFDQIERVVMYDAPMHKKEFRDYAREFNPSSKSLLPYEPLKGRIAPEHNPHLRKPPSKLIRTWALDKPESDEVLRAGEVPAQSRRGGIDSRLLDSVM